MKHTLLSLLIIATLLGCKKKDNTPATTGTTTPTPTPTSTTYIGILSAFRMTVQDLSAGGAGNSYSESGSASYMGTAGLLDAGTISCNDTVMNNFMGLYSTQNPTFMLGFSTNPASVKWAVSGNAANSIPAFNYVATFNFPTQFTLVGLPPVVDTSLPLTANFSSTLSNCDSLQYWLNGVADATPMKTLKSNFSSVSFTAAEMTFAGGGGTGTITVQAYKNSIVSQGGKNVLVRNVTQLQTIIDLQ